MLSKVNFSRNILLNERRPEGQDAAPWERYMPETFTGIPLPGFMENIRKALVSKHPDGDWWDKTYRVEALITELGRARFSHLSTSLDSRTTPMEINPVDFPYGNTLTGVNGAAKGNTTVALITPKAAENVPVRRRWTITAMSPTVLSVEFTNTGLKSETKIVSASGATRLDEDIFFSVDPASLVTGSLWRVESVTRPTNNLVTSIASVAKLGSNVTKLALTTKVKEKTDLKRIKEKSLFNDDRLIAVLLLYIYEGGALIS